MSRYIFQIISICLIGITFLLTSCSDDPKIDFSTQVKPIINNKCIACHGGVKKQGGLSFLFEEEALAKLESGKYAIVPGNPKKSEMIRRLTLEDVDSRMPFEEEKLSDEEIDILTKWVKQGAKWGKHWAYEPIEQITPPEVKIELGRNAIDQFIAAQISEQGLQPSPRAEPEILARRLGLDIIGLPPSSMISADFISDPSDDHYEALVDSLLDSPHFGEKWTSMWLDLARYADTKGYERDSYREIWRYRDWLIKAFNDDMPYDQFVTEQLAGDLLPDPTDDQYLATAFHRNTMTNDEGGTNNEEFRTAAVIDRVNTTWEALMGTSFGCVQCHSHPYDPFTHEEYYQFLAFFNNTRDEDTYADYPVIRHFDTMQLASLEVVENWMLKEASQQDAGQLVKFIKTLSPARNSLTTDEFVNAELADTKWLGMRNHSSARLEKVALDGRTKLLFSHRSAQPAGVLEVRIGQPDGRVIATYNFEGEALIGWTKTMIDVLPVTGEHDIYFTYDNPTLDNPDEKGVLFDWFYFMKDLPGREKEDFVQVETQFWDLINAPVPNTPIMVDNPAQMSRQTHLFERGSWLIKGQEVEPGTPHTLHEFGESVPRNRLGLAQWIMSENNPLASRTIVNRIWEQLFGVGLVETLEDMGTQGANPLNQDLLDFLAWQMMHEYDWSLKTLIKNMVLSATYRQSSTASPEQIEKDPFNRYFARMSRIRLSAEQVRDQALAVSGVLNDKLFGPPVMPHQPDGIWSSPYDGSKWTQSEGEDKYRRAVYTYWKRTSPYPSMITFDGVGREFCTSRRIRTNTPLQALATLNDAVFIDLSRQLAKNVWDEDRTTMITKAYESVTQKKISPSRLAILENLFEEALAAYKKDARMTRKICAGMKTEVPEEFAAMVMVSNSILNLDEVITKT